jgi:hypothetical protein
LNCASVLTHVKIIFQNAFTRFTAFNHQWYIIMHFSFSTHFQFAISIKKLFFRNLLDHNANKWSRTVNPHLWGVRVPQERDADVKIKEFKIEGCVFSKKFQEIKIKLHENNPSTTVVSLNF